MSRTYKDQPTTVQAARNGESIYFVDDNNPSLQGEELVGKEAKNVLLERKKDQYDEGNKSKFVINDHHTNKENNDPNTVEPSRSQVNQELRDSIKEYNSTFLGKE